ncbi:50S ribosomal protein L11 methyltransferase [Aurantiacibacter marinus]|uniref:Methyltransferase domain-containing protein n=1 Tax=Aurantiacibacter marinus TaxID=874156 RepID=A0A0H0XRJ1_9SPHN|nr:50S ribosomal protein L11 methyltransferase [Aurantiacibacter marinus]KLI64621.1 hypothetical protein AAV99_03440 [Aurantiacibacter marinus]
MPRLLDEHYNYLALANRLPLFERALGETIRDGDIVADLGCGFGVLGILALKAGAARCYGIDSSDAVEIARETARREGLTDSYRLMRGSTFDISLPQPVDVLICDHVGYFGFDYGIIAMLADARARMLRPGGRIIPERMNIGVALVESEDAYALADRWSREPVPENLRWLQEHGVNSQHAIRLAASDQVSPAVTIASVDFNQEPGVTMCCDIELIAARDAVCHGIAGFFDCTLSRSVRMTNSPLAEDRIDRANGFLPVRRPFAVKAGDTVRASFTIRHDPAFISWTVQPLGGKKQSMSTWHSTILEPADLAPGVVKSPKRSSKGDAVLAVLQLVGDGISAAEIEHKLLETQPDICPTPERARVFVRDTLKKYTR